MRRRFPILVESLVESFVVPADAPEFVRRTLLRTGIEQSLRQSLRQSRGPKMSKLQSPPSKGGEGERLRCFPFASSILQSPRNLLSCFFSLRRQRLALKFEN